jgi:hypothetical protein
MNTKLIPKNFITVKTGLTVLNLISYSVLIGIFWSRSTDIKSVMSVRSGPLEGLV